VSSYNPYEIVSEFENRIAEWCGAPYGVAVESGTAAIFLSLQYRKKEGMKLVNTVIPNKTYPSVPCGIIHSGGNVKFHYSDWGGEYELYPLRVWDAALRFKRNMYLDCGVSVDRHYSALQCLSFHVKKHLPIGRGGMILTDSKAAYDWLKLARFDGRSPVPLIEDTFTMLGWNMYMQPSDAARGIQLFEVLRQKYPDGMEDLKVEEQGYADLSQFPIYHQ
jgi:dTDP-4-amino-4,6-dideoxygalactose transaminase